MFGRIDSFLSNGWKITAFNGEEGLYCEQFIPRDLLAMRNAFLFLFVPLPFLFFLE